MAPFNYTVLDLSGRVILGYNITMTEWLGLYKYMDQKQYGTIGNTYCY